MLERYEIRSVETIYRETGGLRASVTTTTALKTQPEREEASRARDGWRGPCQGERSPKAADQGRGGGGGSGEKRVHEGPEAIEACK